MSLGTDTIMRSVKSANAASTFHTAGGGGGCTGANRFAISFTDGRTTDLGSSQKDYSNFFFLKHRPFDGHLWAAEHSAVSYVLQKWHSPQA